MKQKKLVAAEAPYLATQSAKMATKVVRWRRMVRKVLCTRFPGKRLLHGVRDAVAESYGCPRALRRMKQQAASF